jgi:hypothetical protein
VKHTQLQEGEIFTIEANAGVVQDNKPPWRLAEASGEPATAEDPAVGEKGGAAAADKTHTPPAVDRPTHHGSETRRTEQVSGRVPPVLKTQLLALAKQQGARTESRAVKMAIEVFVANEFGRQFLTMIRQTIEAVVREEFRTYTNRMGKLNFNAYLAAEQARLLHIEEMRATMGAAFVSDLTQIISRCRQQAQNNLKFYNYSIDDVEQAATETLPWQS